MKDKLIELVCEIIQTGECIGHCNHPYCHEVERIADHLVANNVFVLPEKMNDSWELVLPFIMRLFVADEAEIEKIRGEFECQKVKQILTDIRDYIKSAKGRTRNSDMFILQIQAVEKFADKALSDLTEYAEKLGVEL